MRVRFRFTKLGKIRFTGHRDVARIWERTLRRCALPVAYTEGFSPRPKLHFGLALPTCYESDAEYVDVDFGGPVDVATLPATLTASMPDGIEVVAAEAVERSEPSLQQAVSSATWSLLLDGADRTDVEHAVNGVLAAESLPYTRERKGRTETQDMRPALLAAIVVGESEGSVELHAELGTQPLSIRPGELLGVLPLAVEATRVRRLHQWMSPEGARREPLPNGATRAPHARETVERAS